MKMNTIDNVMSNVDKLDCWLWRGATTKRGYGKVTVNYKTVAVHRFVYESLVGSIPSGLQIDHICGNKLCVNPHHLEAVSQRENIRRYTSTIIKCNRGHDLCGDNLYITPDGRRNCKACRRESVALWSMRRQRLA